MSLLDELAHPTLATLWSGVARRLEATGLQPVGSVTVDLDDAGADLLGGVLGRWLRPGRRRVALPDLDAALRASPAATTLVDVARTLHGPLRDRPAERQARHDARRTTTEGWTALLTTAGLTGDWTRTWTEGLRTAGLLGPPQALETAVRAVALVLSAPAPRTLGELAAAVAGDAHALDAGRRAGAVALRGLAAARSDAPPSTADERALLWSTADVRTDDVSGTVLVLGWRPPGPGRWAGMMRERADLGLPTHLTLREVRAAPGPLTGPGHALHVCENPQVVQAAADRGVPGPLLCLQGNPSAAGSLLLDRLSGDGADVQYHGDFDWPGLAIAGRVLARGARPWLLGAADYLGALPGPGVGVPLTGTGVPTPWDPALGTAMQREGRAVHEEALLGELIADLLRST